MVALSIILLLLLVALFILYKKLNKDTNGEYTVRRMVYKEGGLRDQVRGVAVAMGTRLGVQLWPGSDGAEDGEEMQEIQDEEEQVDSGGSEGSDTDGDEEEEEDNEEQSSKAEEKSNNLNDKSSIASSQAGEQDKLTDEPEAKEETAEKSEEKVGEEQSTAEASGGPGLLIDLKQFSGSAIWSEEGGGESKGDVTAL